MDYERNLLKLSAKEAGGHAGRLVDYLSRHFGSGSVFRDIDTIRPGEDFAQAIESALNACDVVLVVIGNTWDTGTGQDGRRRLDDPNDWVRLEVAAALRRNVLVIPVLVDGARLPDPASMPEELRPLCRRNARELTDPRWPYDVGELVKDIQKVIQPPQRLKFPSINNKMLSWFAGSAVVLGLLILVGSAILRVQPPGPNSLISPTPIPIVPAPAPSQGKQPAPSPQDGVFRQETRVAGVVAELTRFVRSGNLITAEVALRNTGSDPAIFSCEDWQLIDEQTSHVWKPDIEGGRVSSSHAVWHHPDATLAPGATHVTWAKFKVEAGALSGGKYAVNVESILNRPFEGLVPKSQ